VSPYPFSLPCLNLKGVLQVIVRFFEVAKYCEVLRSQKFLIAFFWRYWALNQLYSIAALLHTPIFSLKFPISTTHYLLGMSRMGRFLRPAVKFVDAPVFRIGGEHVYFDVFGHVYLDMVCIVGGYAGFNLSESCSWATPCPVPALCSGAMILSLFVIALYFYIDFVVTLTSQ